MAKWVFCWRGLSHTLVEASNEDEAKSLAAGPTDYLERAAWEELEPGDPGEICGLCGNLIQDEE